MGLLSKIKGIFIEEVEEETEEDTVQLEKIKEKTPVAKKIESPVQRVEEKKEEKEIPIVEPAAEVHETVSEETKEFSRPIELNVQEEAEHKFPMEFDDKDFEMDYTGKIEIIQDTPSVPEPEPEPVKEEPILYHGRRSEREIEYHFESPIGVEPYENNKKTGFQRSPIISPVYGILDKNYRRDEIVSKREIRLTTNNKKGDLDLVREKAYGELANDITESINEEKEVKEETKEEKKVDKDNLFYDLSEDASPSVKVVTVGDAEEYFNDLGLEYNVDYKVAKEEPVEENKEEKVIEDFDDIKEEVKPEVKEEKEEESKTDDELFDLIDAMYESK